MNNSSARIIGVRRIRVRRRDLTKACTGKVGQIGAAKEIGVVKGVQEFTAQFEINPLGDLDLLHQAQIEASEARSGDVNVLRSALAVVNLNASGAVGRRASSRGRK